MSNFGTDDFTVEFWVTLTKRLELGFDDNQSTPYWVRPHHYSIEAWNEMSAWLEKTLGESRWDDIESKWIGSNQKYWFRNEQDRTMFVLRWA